MRGLEQAARTLLRLLLALVFGGVFGFLRLPSPLVLYLFYGLLIAGIGLRLLARPAPGAARAGILPYAGWLAVYFLWGSLVSPYLGLVTYDLARAVLWNGLFLGAVGVGLATRRDLVAFAGLAQVAAIGNGLLALGEVARPELIPQIAYLLNPAATAFSELRPAGLWADPNSAGFALLFALWLSYWAARPLRWAGRVAALAGIYLTASRTTIYILVVCALLVVLYRFWRARSARRDMLIFALGVALVGSLALGVAVVEHAAWLPGDLAQPYTISRLLDPTEATTGGFSHTALTALVWDRAQTGPWYGRGIFAFQGLLPFSAFTGEELGAHNIYLVVFGETGIPGIMVYGLALAAGLWAVGRAGGAPGARLALLLLWITYLLIGFTWHNQLTDPAGILYAGLIYQLPQVIAQDPVPAALPHAPTRTLERGKNEHRNVHGGGDAALAIPDRRLR
jgi:hypothetical protein